MCFSSLSKQPWKECQLCLLTTVPWGRTCKSALWALIPKKSKPGKWRLIVNLSALSGASVNDGIDKECSSLYYPTVEDLALVISRLGIPSKSQCQGGILYGACASPGLVATGYTMGEGYLHGQCFADWAKICPADAAQWILLAKGVENLLHHLDDFIFAASSRSAAKEMKQVLIDTWAHVKSDRTVSCSSVKKQNNFIFVRKMGTLVFVMY